MAKKPAAGKATRQKSRVKKASSGKTQTTAKRPAPKRAAAKRPANASSAREKLAAELVGMIPEIDAEGLLFLVRQANVLLHNKRVDELNAEMEMLNAGRREARKRAGTTARVGENVKEVTVEVQQSSDAKTYYLIVDGQKHFFTSEEMGAVVKLCFKPERKSDALRLLHQYLDNERREVLMEHGISAGNHPFFEALFYEVRAKFSLNE